MFCEIGNKINALMAIEGISGMKLAKKLGIPASTFKKLRSQEITNPTLATLVPIARYFSVPLEYFLAKENPTVNDPKGIKNLYPLPLLSWSAAARFPSILAEQISFVLTDRQYGKEVFALRIEERNASLFPVGSFIIVDSSGQAKHRDLVICGNDHQCDVEVRQFIEQDGKHYLLSLTDKHITPLTKQCRLLGILIEYQRELISKNSIVEKEE